MSYAPRSRGDPPTNIAQEPTGAIASDSLAAESIDAGGEFAQNDNAVPLGVRGAQSTLNTTDTSGATTLQAARDRESRADEDDKGLGADEKGASGGVKYPQGAGEPETESASAFTGATGDSFASSGAGTGISSSETGPDPNIRSTGSGFGSGTGTTTATKDTTTTTTTTSSSSDATQSSSAEDAPNYAGVVSGAIRPHGENKPKGKDLVEGNVPKTKTFTGNVGGDKDPGRLAEREFEQRNAETDDMVRSGTTGLSRAGDGQGDANAFDALNPSERA